MPDQPAWMQQEEKRADTLAKTGKTANDTAPKLVKKRKASAPSRMQKALFVQEQYANAFDRLVFAQKMAKGKKAPELAEEAIELLLKKYGAKL